MSTSANVHAAMIYATPTHLLPPYYLRTALPAMALRYEYRKPGAPDDLQPVETGYCLDAPEFPPTGAANVPGFQSRFF